MGCTRDSHSNPIDLIASGIWFRFDNISKFSKRKRTKIEYKCCLEFGVFHKMKFRFDTKKKMEESNRNGQSIVQFNQFVYKANVFLSNCHIKFICFFVQHASRNRPNHKTNLLNSMNEIRIVNEIIWKWMFVFRQCLNAKLWMLKCASLCFMLWHLFYLGIQ